MRFLILLPAIVFAFTTKSCKNQVYDKKEQTLTTIDSLEKIISTDPDLIKNMKTANELIHQVEEFVKAYPQDSIVPELLLKAGEIARGLGKYDQATELLQAVWTKHQNHRLAPPALLLQAFTYDNDLQDSTLAIRYYQEFMKRYPNHEMATQVQQLIQLVGKKPEELIRTIQKQQESE